MAEKTAISWCDHTYNPWWGCIEVSPACDNCYARTFAKRTGHNVWGPAKETPRRFFADKHWAEPVKWNAAAEKEGERRRVFCASMADVFELNQVLDEHRERLWELIDETRWLDWMLLTKRPENIRRMVPPSWLVDPLPHVWYGTTVENQHYADQRIPILLRVPARVRFLSMEPLLGPVDLGPMKISGRVLHALDAIDWVITGGESGPGARPSHPDWYRSIRDQCQADGVAYHHKQNGEWLGAGQVDADGAAVSKDAGALHYWDWENANAKQLQEHGMDYSVRVGVKRAGHLLDGVEHFGFPEVQAR